MRDFTLFNIHSSAGDLEAYHGDGDRCGPDGLMIPMEERRKSGHRSKPVVCV
jgi:hypothetical protein